MRKGDFMINLTTVGKLITYEEFFDDTQYTPQEILEMWDRALMVVDMNHRQGETLLNFLIFMGCEV